MPKIHVKKPLAGLVIRNRAHKSKSVFTVSTYMCIHIDTDFGIGLALFRYHYEWPYLRSQDDSAHGVCLTLQSRFGHYF
ncbi:GM14084 [Drosophila sechellia]|uniref:GM14084 n=1 Tax=Drosophila sechellia TaxID=7238 RepID=B4HTK1_DROSE|nr:GM14084 [Drosophila sechellia]